MTDPHLLRYAATSIQINADRQDLPTGLYLNIACEAPAGNHYEELAARDRRIGVE